MKNTFGIYNWFKEDGRQFVNEADLKIFENFFPFGKVFECIDQDENFISIKYGNKVFRVKSDLYKQIPDPQYRIGEEVELVKKNREKGNIVDIKWHGKLKKAFYYISLNGKKKSLRYFDEDFI